MLLRVARSVAKYRKIVDKHGWLKYNEIVVINNKNRRGERNGIFYRKRTVFTP